MFIKHERFMDVAIEVNSVRTIPDGTAVIHGRFWVMGYDESYPLDEPIKLKIAAKDFTRWNMCTTVVDNKLRTSPWGELILT